MKKILSLILIFCLILCLSGCSNNQNLENEKTVSEAMYLENGLITIFKKCFQDEYILQNQDIDWYSITEDFNILKNSISVILIDFSSVHIPSESILQLENNFNDLENSIYSKDFNTFFQKITDTYNLISYSILDNISENKEFKLEKKSKSDLLYIGYFIKNSDKEQIQSYMSSFEENYSSLGTSKGYIENNSYKINKVFIEFQNLKSEIELNNFEIAREKLTKILDFF